jgi:hypothetical protein
MTFLLSMGELPSTPKRVASKTLRKYIMKLSWSNQYYNGNKEVSKLKIRMC